MTSLSRLSSYRPSVLAGCCRPWLLMLMILAPYASAQGHSYSLDQLLAFPFSRLLQLEFSPSHSGGDLHSSLLRARRSGQRVVLNVLHKQALPGKTVFLAGESHFAIFPPSPMSFQQD